MKKASSWIPASPPKTALRHTWTTLELRTNVFPVPAMQRFKKFPLVFPFIGVVNHGVYWGVKFLKTHRNGTKWLAKVKEKQSLWQFFVYFTPCYKLLFPPCIARGGTLEKPKISRRNSPPIPSGSFLSFYLKLCHFLYFLAHIYMMTKDKGTLFPRVGTLARVINKKDEISQNTTVFLENSVCCIT